jgi:hypothetical protein
MKKTRMKLLAAALLALGAVGCNAVDCHHICSRYKECFDSKYDESGCEQRCRDNSEKSNNYSNQVNQCDACISDRSCSSATFTCAGDCSNVVP